jgi:alkylation response protein AidB-like acyl-CoA dehydrogenase
MGQLCFDHQNNVERVWFRDREPSDCSGVTNTRVQKPYLGVILMINSDGSINFSVLEAVLDSSMRRAREIDEFDAYPHADMADFAAVGLLSIPLPRSLGGSGLCDEPGMSATLFDILRRVGKANLSLGRLYEGHVNAIKLVTAYGTLAQREVFADAVRAGHTSGVWNAEGTNTASFKQTTPGVFVLSGRKIYASGAGLLSRPIITVASAEGPLMVVLSSSEIDRTDTSTWRPLGMRATATGSIDLEGLTISQESIIGAPGDYFRDPDFHGGAWRYLAVQVGGMEGLVESAVAVLRDMERDGDPLQRARFGKIGLALHTAMLWAHNARHVAIAGERYTDSLVPRVDMARLAVERAGISIIDDVTHSIGLTACLQDFGIERVVRDLLTYLRQPGPDRALTRVGSFTLSNFAPGHVRTTEH